MAPSFETVLVEPQRYFLVGDNRDNSNDSRYFGTIHTDDISGPAIKLYWSWDYNGTYLQLLNPSVLWALLRDKTRWERIGQPIE
jgi:signal peptidase I